MMYRVCPLCGAALDPGERCDCQRCERIRPHTTEKHRGKPRKHGGFPKNMGKSPEGGSNRENHVQNPRNRTV